MMHLNRVLKHGSRSPCRPPPPEESAHERHVASLILGTTRFLITCSGSTGGAVCRDLDASLWRVHFMERTKGAFEWNWANQMTVEWRDKLGGGIETLVPPCLL